MRRVVWLNATVPSEASSGLSVHDLHQLLLRGPELGTSERTDQVIRHARGQVQQVLPNAVAQIVQLELEPVHDAKNGSIGGLRETRFGHGPTLGCNECGVHPEQFEDGVKSLRESLGERGRRRERQQDREQRRLVDQGGGLWPPEDGRGVPVPQRRRRLLDDGHDALLHSIEKLLGAMDRVHGTSVPVRDGRAEASSSSRAREGDPKPRLRKLPAHNQAPM